MNGFDISEQVHSVEQSVLRLMADKVAQLVDGQKIKTFVFFDLETTGLISGKALDDPRAPQRWYPGDSRNNFLRFKTFNEIFDTNKDVFMPRITEFAIVAVDRDLYIDAMNRLKKEHTNVSSETSDIFVNVATTSYVKQINPNLSPSEWSHYEAVQKKCSGMHLRKQDLLFQQTFPEAWPLIRAILLSFPPPIALIAHNGMNFDYRILLSELQRYDLQKTHPFPKHIYFLDSYMAFADIEKTYHQDVKQIMYGINWRRITEMALNDRSKKTGEEQCDGQIDVQDSQASVRSVIDDGQIYLENTLQVEAEARKILRPPDNIVQITPPRLLEENNEDLARSDVPRKQPAAEDYRVANPLNFMNTDDWAPAKRRRLSENFFSRKDNGDWNFGSISANQHFRNRGSFRLRTLYHDVVNGTYNEHYAYDDCIALLRVGLSYGQTFVDYVDEWSIKLPGFGAKPKEENCDSKEKEDDDVICLD
ncbi:hypothetical protein M3Y95_00228300 [Aphelenchoides besseyi]|nr:hypothetical protein M3Y95_00228300 [Aphelenchoides besseyi]